MTHADLVLRAVKWLRGTLRRSVVFAELHTYAVTIPDAIGFSPSDGRSTLVECKVSRADFHRDKGKTGRRIPWLAMADQRYYLAVPGIITEVDLPPGWGLAEVRGKVVRIVVKAPTVERGVRGMREDLILLASACRRLGAGHSLDRATGRFVYGVAP